MKVWLTKDGVTNDSRFFNLFFSDFKSNHLNKIWNDGEHFLITRKDQIVSFVLLKSCGINIVFRISRRNELILVLFESKKRVSIK